MLAAQAYYALMSATLALGITFYFPLRESVVIVATADVSG